MLNNAADSDRWPISRQMWERAKASLSGGVSTGLRAQAKPHPIFFESGSGATLTDVDGNEVIDYVLGWGPNILGHGNARLVAAVTDQIGRGATYGSGHRFEIEAAEAVLGAYPAFDRVLWSNTGTEANLSALRIARAATGREHFVKFAGHYHGWSDTMLLGYRNLALEGDTAPPETRGQTTDSTDLAHVILWGDLDALEVELTTGPEKAAVVMEPVLCNTGVISPAEGYLEAVRELCTRHGAVLIFDEVITGMRLAYGGAVERYSVVPDMVILAKAIAGGLSLAAIVGQGALLDLTQQGVTHAGTYNGNPVVLAAAVATMSELAQPGVFDDLERRGRRLAEGLRAALADAGVRGAVNQVGPVVQVALGIDEIDSANAFLGADQKRYDALLVALLERGIFTLPGGRWYISTAHTDAQIETTIAAFAEAVGAVQAREAAA